MKIIIEAGYSSESSEAVKLQAIYMDKDEPENFTADTPSEAGEMVANLLNDNMSEAEALEDDTPGQKLEEDPPGQELDEMETSWNEEAEERAKQKRMSDSYG